VNETCLSSACFQEVNIEDALCGKLRRPREMYRFVSLTRSGGGTAWRAQLFGSIITSMLAKTNLATLTATGFYDTREDQPQRSCLL